MSEHIILFANIEEWGIKCEREDMNNSTFIVNVIQRSSCFISDKSWSSVGLKANQEKI